MIGGMPLAPRTRPLVGRTVELDRLRRSSGLDAAAPGGSVLLSGDAGIGKSRLVAEAAALADAAGRKVVAGHCVGAGGAALAWLPFVEIAGEIAAAAPEAFQSTLDTHPALAALRPGTTSAPSATDPGLIAEAVHALLSATAVHLPLLLVVEDVHWADHSSRDLLTLLLTRGFSGPVTLVVTYRTDDLHRRHPLHDVLAVWARLPLVTRIDLDPLPGGQMHDLVRELEDAPTTPDAVQAVVSRAEGNPFFAEELVAGGEAARATDDLARLLRLRLDRLDEPARLVVRAASLSGRTVRVDLLAEVVGLDEDTLDDALQQAIDHHILETSGGEDFHFRHSLLGETVADDLLPGARRRLHHAWLAALRARPELGSPADLARHAAATGDTELAATAAIEAGDAAMRVGGARDALRLYEAALGWMPDDPGRRGEIALLAADAAKAAGDQVRSLGLLEEGLPDVDPAAHPLLRAELLGRAAIWYTLLDLPGDPLALSEEAAALVTGRHDEATAHVLVRHLEVLVNHHREAEATRVAHELALLAEELDLPHVASAKRLQLARMVSKTDPERAREELTATAEDERAPAAVRLSALLRLGNVELGAGRLAAAHGHFVAGAEIAARRNRPWSPFGMECRLQAGRSAYELGLWAEAEQILASPADLPHPPRGFMEGALVELQVARGDDVDPERLTETIRWWPVDVLLVVAYLGGMIDLLGRSGQTDRLLHLVGEGVKTIQRTWGTDAQAIIRISALYTGQVSDLAATGGDVAGLRVLADQLDDRVSAIADDPDQRPGAESRTWLRRHAAERLRLAAVTGEHPDPDAMVVAWRETTDAFAALSNRPEHARSAARLAEALALVGRTGEARDAASTARAAAEEIGARPVLDLLDELRGGGTEDTDGSRGPLTPRELEVLTHLDQGRTNGQIAATLFISRKTASVHVSNILAKLGAATRGEAVSIARRQGILS